MLLGLVIGSCTATIKHPSMEGWRLMIVQPLGAQGQPDGEPQIGCDPLGAAVGQKVILNTDGKYAREVIKHDKSPVRFVICALVDG